jgi:hypothetical protein
MMREVVAIFYAEIDPIGYAEIRKLVQSAAGAARLFSPYAMLCANHPRKRTGNYLTK